MGEENVGEFTRVFRDLAEEEQEHARQMTELVHQIESQKGKSTAGG